jgi:hypothetical protein
MCPDGLSNFKMTKESEFMFDFAECTDKPLIGLKCAPKEEANQWLRDHYISIFKVSDTFDKEKVNEKPVKAIAEYLKILTFDPVMTVFTSREIFRNKVNTIDSLFQLSLFRKTYEFYDFDKNTIIDIKA